MLFEGLQLEGAAGPVEARLYEAHGAAGGVVLVGGVGGGFDSPAGDLYAHLARLLPREGISVLRVRFRLPGELEEATADVSAGIATLARRGTRRIALVGHSFGGAVVILAALGSPDVVAVVALSTQSFGTDDVGSLRRPLLLVHGANDEVLAPAASVDVYRRAGAGAELHLVQGAGHMLDEASDEVRALVHGWLFDRLAGDAERTTPAP